MLESNKPVLITYEEFKALKPFEQVIWGSYSTAYFKQAEDLGKYTTDEMREFAAQCGKHYARLQKEG